MNPLRVLTLNLWNRQGPWERRRELIRRGLGELAPDLVALQEVLQLETSGEDQAHELGAGLYPHIVFASAWPIGGGLHLGNAVLSRWPIAAHHAWALPAGEPDQTRGLLHAEIDAPFGPVPFFVTHLAWRLHHGLVRQRQVAFIAERVAEHTTRDHFPAILAGDFNAEPESDEIRFLRGWHALDGRTVCFHDAFAFAGEGPGHTFDRRNPYALRAHEPSRRIDYIFVRPPDHLLRGEPLAARLVFTEPDADGVYASDHFGVYAELMAEPRPPE